MTGAAPLVTVGIPFFDEARYLGAAIRAALAQTFGDFELLLVDDGSTDGSLEIARSFRDPRVAVISDGRRLHLPARLNEIVGRARGTYVARMDGDDVMHPRRLARQLEAIEAEPRCDAVGTWAALVDEEEHLFGVLEGTPLPASPASALERGILSHATMFARRTWLRSNRYDEALSRTEDRDLWCRTAETGRFRIVPECLYVIRLTPGDARFGRDYLESQRQNRLLFRRYGPRLVGLAGTARLLAASHAKSVIMRAAVRAGVAERLVHRRGRPPTSSESEMVCEALAAARQRA